MVLIGISNGAPLVWAKHRRAGLAGLRRFRHGAGAGVLLAAYIMALVMWIMHQHGKHPHAAQSEAFLRSTQWGFSISCVQERLYPHASTWCLGEAVFVELRSLVSVAKLKWVAMRRPAVTLWQGQRPAGRANTFGNADGHPPHAVEAGQGGTAEVMDPI
eukprot:3627249-Amphidinium_carterae.1